MDELTAALQTVLVAKPPEPECSAVCLGLLDRQKTLFDLLEHHDMRERQLVYPQLERTLSPSVKREIVRALLTWPELSTDSMR